MNKKWLMLISILYVVWAAVFIFKSSVMAVDGKRHFLLFDDAMISMRYAWNLSQGNGLVWNAGEYVEGITNFSMTMVMTIFLMLWDRNMAILSVQIFGAIVMLLIAVCCLKIGAFLQERECGKQGSFLSMLFFASGIIYYPLSFWSISGMETGLFSLLLLAATGLSLKEYGDEKATWLIPVLLSLSFYTRPDAAVYIAVIMCFRFLGVYRHSKRFKVFFMDAGIIVFFIALLTLFRFLYYGSIVPNTYTLKMAGIPLFFRLEDGCGFVAQFLKTVWLPVLIAVLGVMRRKDPFSILLGALFFASVIYQIYIGGDPWPYWRMNAPFVPLILILCIREFSFFSGLSGRGNPPAVLTCP